jgi:enterochelin esterase family protein
LRLSSLSLPLFFLLLSTSFSAAQPQALVVSPEVHHDRSITFRFRAPNAKQVTLALEGAEPQALQQDVQGVWTITTSALSPDYYGYSFVADGVRLIDPSNPLLTPNLLSTASALHVPGPSSLPWEVSEVPHGEIHHHFYKSAIAEDDRNYYVYTPPNYDPVAKETYPVLYLLHGYSDDASAWTAVGHANVILDNLIAQGKAKAMVVVMPLGMGRWSSCGKDGARGVTPNCATRILNSSPKNSSPR